MTSKEVGKSYNLLSGCFYRRCTKRLSPFLSDFLRWANTPFSFYSRVWIYTPKFKWYLKKEISIFFSFYYHFSMFEERFSIRTSRAPNARNHRTLFFIFLMIFIFSTLVPLYYSVLFIFYCAAKWPSHTYKYTFFFSHSPSSSSRNHRILEVDKPY